jgi:hypothetical protein
MPQIFISYTQSDQEFAVRLADDLRIGGATVWLDIQNAEPGRYWGRSIERALSESHMMIVVLSRAALETAHVAVEWQAYLEAHRPLVPLLVEACDLPGPLRTRRPVDFTRDYCRALHQLTTRLIESSMRTRRVDPVIWSMGQNVYDYREEKAPPPPPAALPDEDSTEGSVRRMVRLLRDTLLRRLEPSSRASPSQNV